MTKRQCGRLLTPLEWLAIGMITLFAFLKVLEFRDTHFLRGTFIGGIDCSYLTVDKALEKVQQEAGEYTNKLNFIDGTTYEVKNNEIGFVFEEGKFEDIFAKQHEDRNNNRVYGVNDVASLNEGQLAMYLATIPELQQKNMVEPKDAHITWNGNNFDVEKETFGNAIDFNEALDFALQELKGEEEGGIDFSEVTRSNPSVTETDLTARVTYLNNFLKNCINITLSDGTVVTLDANTIKSWIGQDEQGNFSINVDEGIKSFVEELATKVNKVNATIQFKATNRTVNVNVPKNLRAQLNQEKEMAELKDLLEQAKTVDCSPVYEGELLSAHMPNRVEIDIANQHVWMYKNDTLIASTNCVTGNESARHSTPTGVYKLAGKQRDRYLRGKNDDGTNYCSFVKYWMPFNGGIGLHDASWRSKFGGEIYKNSGSHGCVNLPRSVAETIYNNIDKSYFIKEWWENRDVVTLITRPRRFGKTLNMSMLDCFFSNKYANRADLFEGLSIWQDETYRKLQGTYPVIFLSFAAVKAGNLEDAKTQIKQEITRLYWENRNLMKEDIFGEDACHVLKIRKYGGMKVL